MPRDLEHVWQMRRNKRMGQVLWQIHQWIEPNGDQNSFITWLNALKKWYQKRLGLKVTETPVSYVSEPIATFQLPASELVDGRNTTGFSEGFKTDSQY